MIFHDIELTGSLDVSGSLTVDNSGNITSPNISTASFGTINVAGFGNNQNVTDFSSSIASRVASAVAGGVNTVTGGTGLSDSGTNNKTLAIDFSDATLNTNISGAFASVSGGLAGRLAVEEGNVDTLQGRDIIAGTGLTGGGDLTADRTLNVVGGTGITANADDIAVDFTDSTLQSNVSGAFAATSGALASRLTTVEGLDRDDDLNFAGDSGGTLTIDMDSETLTIAGGDNITTAGSGNTLTITNDFTKAGITGSFTSLSSSIAEDIANVTAGGGEFSAGDSGSISTRLTTEESNVDVLQAASGGFSTRISAEEANVDALQARNVIAGTGLTGGGTLAADRTLNVVGGTGITANADDIAVDFTDSTLQSNVSGAFVAASSSIAVDIDALQAASGGLETRITVAEAELENTLVSASAQIATNVSGAFVAASSSIATDINALQAQGGTEFTVGDSGSISTRLTTEESNVDALQARNLTAGTGLTGGGTLASDRSFAVDFSDSTLNTNVSGAFVAASSSIATDIDLLQAGSASTATEINALQAAGFQSGDSASLASRLATEEGNVDTLQARDIIAGTGLTGGGTLAADRTLNVVGGIGITANADDIAIDFTDSTFRSNISGSTQALSASIAEDIANVTAGGGEFKAGDSASIHTRLVAAETELAETLVSASAQISTEVSGAFQSASGSIATDIDLLQAGSASTATEINVLQAASGGFSTRISAEEANVDALQARNLTAGTGLTGGGTLASDRSFAVDFSDSTLNTNVSGAFVAASSSIATDIDALQAGGGEFSAGDSASISTRLAAEEANVDALQARDIIAGTGLTGGGTLAADRTLNVVGGTGITANANDIAVDFTDSTLQSNISGSVGTLSGSLATRFDAIEDASTAVVVTISTPATTWTCAHNLNNRYPTVTVWDASNQVIIPQTITATSTTTTTLTFAEAVAGKASFTFGAGSASGSAASADILSGSTVNGHSIGGDLLPSAHNVYDLGSPTRFWKDLYLSSASLYIDGQKVLSSDTDELTIETSENQSLKLIETGADDMTFQVANGNIGLQATGNGVIDLDAPVRLNAGRKILSSDGNNIHFGDGHSVSGSIRTTDNIIADGNISATSGTGSFSKIIVGGGLFDSASLAAGGGGSVSTENVTSAGALMDSEVTNLAFVKSLASGISSGNVLVANANVADNDFLKIDGTSVEGRTAAEVLSDLSVEAGADVTDATNVAAAGALMDSEVTSLAMIKSLTAAQISGSFVAASGSIATDIDLLQAASGGFSTRVASLESGGGGGGSGIFTAGGGISQKTLADIVTTGSIEIKASGSNTTNTLFNTHGNAGSILQLTDDLSTTLFSVAKPSGLPVMEVSSSGRIALGPFSSPVLVDTSGNLSGSSSSTGSFGHLLVNGSVVGSGGLSSAADIAALGAGILSGSIVTSSITNFPTEVSRSAAAAGFGSGGGGGGGGTSGIFVATGSKFATTNDVEVTGSITAQSTGSDSTIFAAIGTSEQMLTITDSLSGSLFSVVRNSGIPVMEVFSDGNVDMHNLPTSDPGVPGRLYNDSGTLKISL